MQKRFNWPEIHVSTVLISAIAVLALGTELVFRLSSLTFHRLAAREVLSSVHAASGRALLADPLNAPLLVLQKLTHYISHTSIFWLRLPTALMACIAVGLFFYVARRWFNLFTAIVSTVLLASSSYFLHIARLATADVLLLVAPLALCAFATHAARRSGQKTTLPPWFTFTIVAAGLYIPGFLWLLAVIILFQPSILTRPWRQSNLKNRLIAIFLGLLVLTPLVRACILQPSQLLKAWVGIGKIGPGMAILHRFVSIPANLFVHGPSDHMVWLGRMPLIPIAISLLILLGIYELVTKRRRQGLLLGSLLLVSWLLCSIGNSGSTALFVGPLYIIAAAGIKHLINQWLFVFPHNPFARSLGYGVVGLFCLTTMLYGWHAYFVAWPHNKGTEQAFIYQRPSTGAAAQLLQ